VTAFGVGDVPGDAEMLNLRVFEHLVDRVDWDTGHVDGVEFLHSGVGALLGQVRIAALSSSRFLERGAVGAVNEFGLADRLREAFPDGGWHAFARSAISMPELARR
jgi:hypothetical protein